MEVRIDSKDNAGVIVLNGDLDYQSYKDLETAFDTSFSQGKAPIIIDIADVPHIDSVGLGTITKLWKAAEQQSVFLVLAGARRNVRSMIKLVNLDGRIRMFKDVDEAVGELS